MILADIGNTHTVFAREINGELRLISTIQTESLSSYIFDSREQYFVASVVPEINVFFPPGQTMFVSPKMKLPFAFAPEVDFSTLGADRIANATALYHRFTRNALCIDAGSCITAEVLNNEGEFCGGAILPGRRMCRFAVSQKAAQLYATPLAESQPLHMGCDTATALTFGIDSGLIGAVRELINLICSDLGEPADFNVIFTGGDAPFFAQALSREYDPLFTLRGLAFLS